MSFVKDAAYWQNRRVNLQKAIDGTRRSIQEAREASNKTHEEAHTSYLDHLVTKLSELPRG